MEWEKDKGRGRGRGRKRGGEEGGEREGEEGRTCFIIGRIYNKGRDSNTISIKAWSIKEHLRLSK